MPRVPALLIPPRTAVGLLAMQWSTGGWAYGTASLINNQHLVTCSHNLVDAITNPPPRGYAVQVLFYPGYNQQRAANPPGGPSLPVRVGFFHHLYAAGNREWDIAVCRLAAPIAPAPAAYFTPTLTTAAIVGSAVNLTGYPGPRNGEMWEENDQVAGVHVPTNSLLYTHDTWPGNSGSPTWTYDAMTDTTRLHGVHVSRPGDLRRAVMMTAPIIAWINGAVAAPTPHAGGYQPVAR